MCHIFISFKSLNKSISLLFTLSSEVVGVSWLNIYHPEVMRFLHFFGNWKSDENYFFYIFIKIILPVVMSTFFQAGKLDEN